MLRRLGLLSATNRATEDAYLEGPGVNIAPTYQSFALNSVVIDPVDPVTGEMQFTFPVVRVPGTGLDFAFALSYRSGFAYDGPVGRRWEHNWNARFKDGSGHSGPVTRYAGNRADVYSETSSGSNVFTPPVGFFEKSVTRTTSGAPKIERLLQDGTLETYEKLDTGAEPSWYFLTSVKHRDRDNAITLEYDADERLVKIVDTRGREFRLGYDDGDRVVTLADHSSGGGTADRTWTFAYSGADDDETLDSVTAPGSLAPVTEFTYSGAALLASVKAPREVAAPGGASPYLSMTYDGSSRVVTQVYGDSAQKYYMEYDDNDPFTTETDREGVKRIYEYNGNNAITKVRQQVSGGYDDTVYGWDASTALMTKAVRPLGNGTLYQYTDGQLVASAEATSSAISSPPSDLKTSSSGSTLLVTVYTYQTASDWRLLTKIKDPNGNEWKLERDTLGNVTKYKTPEDPSGGWTLAYDSASRLVTATDPEGRVKALDYGATGLLTKVSADPAGLDLETVFARDQYGNVTQVTDPRGNATALARNVRGYVTSVTTPRGRVTDYEYDRNDVVTKVRRDVDYSATGMNAERQTVYTYTILDVVTTVSELYGSSYGSSRTFDYDMDKEDRVTLVTLPRTNQTKTVYDTRGFPITQTVAYGETYASDEITAYDANGRVTSRKNGLGQETTFSYDGFDRAVTVADPAGHYRTTAYDYAGNVTETAAFKSGGGDPLAKTALQYDDDNRLTKRRTWAKTHNAAADIGSGWIDASYLYDKADLLTQKSDPCGSCGGGAGGTTGYVYDAAGRLSKTTPALGGYSIALRDKNGQVTKVSNYEIYSSSTKTYVVEHEYDADRALTKTMEKGGGSDTALTTTYAVDGFGAVREITDPNGSVTQHVYDDLGRHVTAIRAAGTGYALETYTVYDANGNVLTRTCKKSGGDSHVRYEYDLADRVTKHYDELGSDPEIYAYDKGHRLTLRTDRKSDTCTNTYDSRGLLTTKTYAMATVVGPTVITFAYDGLGRVTKAYNDDALVERKWNSLSRIEVESNWIDPTNDSGGGSTKRDVKYAYDADGRVLQVEYPDGAHTVQRSYDALGRTIKIEKKEGAGSWTDVAKWTFSGPARMTKLELGSDRSREELSYDVYGRATKLTWDRLKDGARPTTLDFRRGYDAGGRVRYERRDYYRSDTNVLLNDTRDYGDLYRYDQADRLTKVVRGVGYGKASGSHDEVETDNDSTEYYVTKAHYTLDGGGNRSSLVYDVPGTTSVKQELYTFDAQNQLLTRREVTTGTTITKTNTFDANGAQTKSATAGGNDSFDVKVDFEGRIYEAKDWGASSGPGSLWFRYRYDPFGRRVERKEITSGTSTLWTRTYFDGVQPIEEVVVEAPVSPSTTPTEAWAKFVRVYGPYLVDQILWARGDLFDMGGYYMYEGYYQGDFLGTVQVIVSDVGNAISTEGGILEAYRYTEYGEVQFCSGTGTYYSPNVSAGEQDFTYTGREWTQEVGAYYYRARWYRAAEGVFGGEVARNAGRNMYALMPMCRSLQSAASLDANLTWDGALLAVFLFNPMISMVDAEAKVVGVMNKKFPYKKDSRRASSLEVSSGHSSNGGRFLDQGRVALRHDRTTADSQLARFGARRVMTDWDSHAVAPISSDIYIAPKSIACSGEHSIPRKL
jgi:YD repeat-containing protein